MPHPHPALHGPCPPSLPCGHALCLDGHSADLTGGVGVTEGRYHFIAPCGLLHCGNKDTPPRTPGGRRWDQSLGSSRLPWGEARAALAPGLPTTLSWTVPFSLVGEAQQG